MGLAAPAAHPAGGDTALAVAIPRGRGGSRLARLASAPWRLARHVWREGPFGAARRVVRAWRAARRERWLGISTAGCIPAGELGFAGRRLGYQPIDYHLFESALARVGWSERDVFADYGCGMGRAVVLAGLHPLARVIGIEQSPELCAIANENIRRAASRLRCRDVGIVCGDATQFEPPDDLSLVFLFNPFTGDVLERTLEALRLSLVRSPRRLRVIYALPAMDADPLAGRDWLRPCGVLADSGRWVRVEFYEHEPGRLGPREDAS